MRYGKLLLLLLAVALASPAGVIFSENFEGATPGYDSTIGVIPGTLFSLTAGSIDVNGTGYYASLCVIPPESGNCIDTTGGSLPVRGTLQTTNQITFTTPGSYVLSFDLEGWYQPGITDAYATVRVDLGSLIVDNEFTVYGADNPYPVDNIPFTVTSPGTLAYLTFTDLSGDYSFAGGILDNVSISSTPEPGSVLLFGVGALIVLARKRVRR
jgi:hypothetical protein